jgi:hypothetical protein
VFVVSPGQSIQAALDSAQPGDEVILTSGTYYEALQLVDGVDLLAQIPGTVIIDAEAEATVIAAQKIGNNTLVEGITFRHGSAQQGGGLFSIGSSLTFLSCTFEDNAAVLGGGVSLTQGSTVVFDACTFQRNVASVGAGLHMDFSSATVVNSFISHNQASSDGGAAAIQNGSEALFENNCVYANRAIEGAIISIVYSSPIVRHCTITDNQDDAGLGALGMHGSAARIELCLITFNSGPGLQCIESDFAWVGCNDLFGNLDDTLCGSDQGGNLSLDPLFCNPELFSYNVQSDSPILGTVCGSMGAHLSTCPALTSVETRTWSQIKLQYRD